MDRCQTHIKQMSRIRQTLGHPAGSVFGPFKADVGIGGVARGPRWLAG
jgi:hypothetical protein